MSHSHLLLLCIFSCLSWCISPIHGAEAVFSKDGNRIFFAAQNLKTITFPDPVRLDIITSAPLPEGEDIQAVSRARDGSILCLSAHHVVVFDPQRQVFTKLYDHMEEGVMLKDLAVNPYDGLLLVSMKGKAKGDQAEALNLICFEAGKTQPLQVINCRVPEMEGPIFDSAGNLFFSCQGDLWEGSIDIEAKNGETTGVVKKRGILSGIRVAPLARLETYEETPEGTGVLEIAPVYSNLYIQTQRWHGTGWGSILKMAIPTADEFKDGQYQDFISILSTVKVIDNDAPVSSFLCASPDGRRVFYSKADTFWLIENGGKPQLLPLNRSEARAIRPTGISYSTYSAADVYPRQPNL